MAGTVIPTVLKRVKLLTNENRSNRHLTQSELQVKGCTAKRYCRLRSNGASNLPKFRILAYFPYAKPLQRTFR